MERGAEGGTHEEIMYSVAVDYKLSIEGAQQA
jgi:hypothetical protein